MTSSFVKRRIEREQRRPGKKLFIAVFQSGSSSSSTRHSIAVDGPPT